MAAAALLASACDVPRRADRKDAADADAAVVLVDAPPLPPPSVDAGPPPAMSCSVAAPTCELPPSTCLDNNYLVYYNGSSCVNDVCEYMEFMLYCPNGCSNAGCFGGFT